MSAAACCARECFPRIPSASVRAQLHRKELLGQGHQRAKWRRHPAGVTEDFLLEHAEERHLLLAVQAVGRLFARH